MTRLGKSCVLIIAILGLLSITTNAFAIQLVIDPAINPDLILKPIDIGDIPFNPPVLDPCLLATLTLTMDMANVSTSPATSDSDSYQKTYAMPILKDGTEVGFLKIEYDRLNVSGDNGIQFVTAHDTFYFNDGFTAFGMRRYYEYGVYNGTGVMTKVVDGDNNVLDIDVSYTFDLDDEQVCVFVQ